jgi:hypothetical protein
MELTSSKHNEQYKADLIEKRGWNCEWCQVMRATELHHALIGRRKGVKELDCEYNYMCVCHECHAGSADTQIVKSWFWMVQCERYGFETMTKWIKSLPLKLKPDLYMV